MDALEDLFTSGVLSLFVDACTLVSILVVVFHKAFGAFLLLVIVLPFLFGFTRFVQKSMLKNEIDNRNAIAKTNAILPETVQNLLTIQNLKVQAFMEKRYGKAIQDSYEALQKNEFLRCHLFACCFDFKCFGYRFTGFTLCGSKTRFIAIWHECRDGRYEYAVYIKSI